MDAEAASRKPRVLLCASGSVATVKVPEIALKLAAFAEVCMFMVHFVGARERASVADIVDDDDYLWDDTKQVKIVVTKAGDFFLQKVGEYNPTVWEEFAKKREQIEVIRDEQEWEAWHVVGDKVLHIELKDWADAILVAPMSANTLAKIANGLSDNLLTCIARAWSVRKPFIYAPAMNTDMWDHPMTAKHLRTLGEYGYEMIPPVEKMLACGVIGSHTNALLHVEDEERSILLLY